LLGTDTVDELHNAVSQRYLQLCDVVVGVEEMENVWEMGARSFSDLIEASEEVQRNICSAGRMVMVASKADVS
jgi:hypothetical protein